MPTHKQALKPATSKSKRILSTPSAYAKNHYLYIQEVGSLLSIEPHISSRHNLLSYLFFSVISGKGYLTYEGKRHVLYAGDCVWIDCHKLYSHESSEEEPWSLTWVHFYGKDAKEFYDVFMEQGHSYVFHPLSISPFVECITTLYDTHNHQTFLTELSSHKYLTDIIALCYTESGLWKSDENGLLENSMRNKLKHIREFIDNHFTEKISLDDLAEHFFISKYHLSREFHKEYGITIGNDITAKKISKAKSLLRFTKDPIENIADLCGFQDSGYFIKVFKNAENMTPLEYRKKW
ncbi:MAG TPA: AraC family transcriptional regulator [Lachnospiraceae bacterium]|nr:AraC family transcriptional regulator [Lachnospiraceae bacterium]